MKLKKKSNILYNQLKISNPPNTRILIKLISIDQPSPTFSSFSFSTANQKNSWQRFTQGGTGGTGRGVARNDRRFWEEGGKRSRAKTEHTHRDRRETQPQGRKVKCTRETTVA